MATGSQIVFTGSNSEVELVASARSRMSQASVSLAGGLDLGQLGALLAGAQVLVSNNTGPVHIAAALGTPVVVLYALTNPQHTPWKTNCRVLFEDVACRNCLSSVCREEHHGCLLRVEPQAVVHAALELAGLHSLGARAVDRAGSTGSMSSQGVAA
jgi:ADP-heptose:LPS heptosyltransferase